MTDKDQPFEAFKRATESTIKAIAENDELEVAFGQGAPAVAGSRVRVPLPSLGCTPDELDAVRGVGDEFALKMRYHDERLHRSRAPRSGPAST